MQPSKMIRTAIAVGITASVMSLTVGGTAYAVDNSGAFGPGQNLLSNPGHEHPGAYFAGRGELNVAWNWVPFWEEPPQGDDLRDPYFRTPEFRPVFASQYPYRVHSGGGADRWFNFYALNHAAGVMQVIKNLPVGQTIRFSTWAELWSSNDTGNPPLSTNDGNLRIRVCIQTDGGPRNMVSPDLKCSDWSQPYDKWKQIYVDVVTTGPVVLALIQTDATITVQHNDAYADDSCLEVLPSAKAAGICLGAGFVPSAIDGNAAAIAAEAAISPSPVADGSAQTVANGATGLNIRSSPVITTGNVVGVAKKGDVFEVTGHTANWIWYQVQYKGKNAYLYASLTIPNAAAKASSIVK